MIRPILNLWRYLLQASVPWVTVGMLAGALAALPSWPWLALAAIGVPPLLFDRRSRWVWRFVTRVRRFRTARAGRIVLHYAPGVDARWDMPTLLDRCRAELDGLTERFGFPLRGRVVVYLFASHKDVGAIFGPRFGGIALPLANAIVIPDDCNVRSFLRHEFAHLYAARWGELVPPLLSEGIAVYLEADGYRPIDAEARSLLRNRSLKLPQLLKPKYFFAEPQRSACYALAGSFTGFLIRRYGWRNYRKLYRSCDGLWFRAKFAKCLGVSLEKAEWQWRNELLVPEVLKRRRRRVV